MSNFKFYNHLHQVIRMPSMNKRSCITLFSFFITTFMAFLFNTKVFAVTNSTIDDLTNLHKIVQDNQGYVWLAGQHGLTRFDGQETTVFTAYNKKYLLPFTWVHDALISEDSLIVATETHGLWKLDTKTGQAELIFDGLQRKSFYDVALFKGHYYLNVPDKFYKLSVDTKKITEIASDIKIMDIAQSRNNLYVTSKNGLYKLKNNKLTLILEEPILAITSLDDKVIASTASKLYAFLDDGTITHTKVNERIYGLVKSSNDNAFFTLSYQGTIEKYSATSLNKQTHQYENISKDRTNTLFQDSSGVLWVANNTGVTRLTEHQFKNYPKTFDISINANEITLLNDEIIIGSYGAGLQNFKFNTFNEKSNANFTTTALRISSVLNVNNTLYIGTFDGVWVFNQQTKQVSRLNFPNNDKLVIKLKHEADKLYITTNHNGLYVYNLTLKTITQQINHLVSNEVIDVLPLPNEELWLATGSGIEIVTPYNTDISKKIIPTKSKVISLLYANNKIFASTLDEGILVFNHKGDLLQTIAKTLGFRSMVKLKEGIFVTSRAGLYQLFPQTYQLKMLEGTQKYSFVGTILSHQDSLYAAHYAGILSINLKPTAQFHPKVIVSKSIISGNHSIENKAINLDDDNDVVILYLASLDYRLGVEKQFKYRINNGNWETIGGHQLTLTDLDSGTYHIEIKGTNSLGQWSENQAFSRIVVKSPWYTSYIAILVYVITATLVFFIGGWLLYLRAKSINQIHKTLQSNENQNSNIQESIARNLHILKLLVAQKDNDQALALINDSIETLTDQSNNKISQLTGDNLIDSIEHLSEHLLQKYKIKIHSHAESSLTNLPLTFQANAYKVIFEAISWVTLNSNVTRFEIYITLNNPDSSNNKLWISLFDYGNGFSPFANKINFSPAHYIVRNIAKKYNGSIQCYQDNEKGSQLLINMTCPKDIQSGSYANRSSD